MPMFFVGAYDAGHAAGVALERIVEAVEHDTCLEGE
jgi:hypothetical protein